MKQVNESTRYLVNYEAIPMLQRLSLAPVRDPNLKDTMCDALRVSVKSMRSAALNVDLVSACPAVSPKNKITDERPNNC